MLYSQVNHKKPPVLNINSKTVSVDDDECGSSKLSEKPPLPKKRTSKDSDNCEDCIDNNKAGKSKGRKKSVNGSKDKKKSLSKKGLVRTTSSDSLGSRKKSGSDSPDSDSATG